MDCKIPRYILKKEFQAASAVFVLLFLLAFLRLFTPLHLNFSLAPLLLITAGVLALSRVLLCRRISRKTTKSHPFLWWHYLLWMIAELVLVTLLYTLYYGYRHRPPIEDLAQTGALVLGYLALIIASPTLLSHLSILWYQQSRALRQLLKPSITPTTQVEPPARQLIYLTDTRGNLRLSVDLDHLYYVESQDNHIVVAYKNKDLLCKYTLRCQLQTIEDRFKGTQLARCHRSYIINLQKVAVLRREKEGLFAHMDCEGIPPIPISRSYSHTILQHFSQ